MVVGLPGYMYVFINIYIYINIEHMYIITCIYTYYIYMNVVLNKSSQEPPFRKPCANLSPAFAVP